MPGPRFSLLPMRSSSVRAMVTHTSPGVRPLSVRQITDASSGDVPADESAPRTISVR
jgi:hypothetical protein